jgi:hypothetical protein
LCTSSTICFNPRAREGRDGPGPIPDAEPVVSIHAPAKGATRHVHPF